MVSKGKVSSVFGGGKMATVTPYTGELVTAGLVVSYHLAGVLAVGDPVIYAMFPDNTGIILHREDGRAYSGTSDSYNISARIENNVLVLTADFGIDASVENGVLVLSAPNGGISSAVESDVLILKTVGSSSAVAFTTDETLTLSPEGVLSVNTADVVEKDNTLPVTSAAVHTVVGNVEALLELI